MAAESIDSLFDLDDDTDNGASAAVVTAPAPAPAPAQATAAKADEPKPTDTDDPLRKASEPFIPKPVVNNTPPPGFESVVEEHEPTFHDVDADVRDAVADDADFPADVPPNPFAKPVNPDLVGDPTPNLSAAPADDDDLPPWERDRKEREKREQEEREAMRRAHEEAISEGSMTLPGETDERFDGFAGNADTDSGSRADFIRSKVANNGLVEKTKEFIKRNPRPVIVGVIGLVALLVMAVVLPAGDPASDPVPDALPPDVSVEVPADPSLGEPVTLLPRTVAADCGPGQTNPALAFNNNQQDAWICPRAHGIDGAIMNIQFKNTVQVVSVTVMPGWNYVAPNGRDRWNEHRVVTRIRWRAGGKEFIHNIDPTRAGSTYTFNPPKGVATNEMSLTIFATERPNAAGAEVDPETGGGGILPPILGGGGNDDVDKTFAIGSIAITGYELG